MKLPIVRSPLALAASRTFAPALPPRHANHMVLQRDVPAFPRERELLDFLSEGLSNKEIADRMSLSVETVRDYLKRIYDKLHVRSRTEAALKYRAASSGLPR